MPFISLEVVRICALFNKTCYTTGYYLESGDKVMNRITVLNCIYDGICSHVVFP